MTTIPLSGHPERDTPGVSFAASEWRALAPAVAGSARMRVSRDGGRTYTRRYERDLSETLPNQPAAVLIYDRSGCARAFCVDLDVSRGGRAAVDRDLAALRALLRRLDVAHFADRSPNGGVHVYVPLEEPVPFPEAAATARALAARTPSMDPMPMLGLQGLIRPPGARHSSGGHQLLIDTLTAAYDATRRPTTAAAWARFVDELHVAPETTPHPGDVDDEISTRLSSRGRHTAPDATYQAIARTGQYDPDRYATASEARQAVIWSAVASGWTLTDVARRLSDGTWPGLAAMYARYRPQSRHGALSADWRAAVTFEKRRRERQGSRHVRVGPTSPSKTHPHGITQRIRTWLNAVRLLHHGERDALAQRAVLYALGEAAMKSQSLTVEFGNRSLAVATGLNPRTVGKVLKVLEHAERPLIELTEPARGVRANAWTLTVPDTVAADVDRMSWRRGRIHGVRPAFQELGLAAAFIYASLEHASEPLSGRDLATDAGLGHTAGADALDTLAAFGLAHRSPTGWTLGTASLDQLAEQFGIVDAIRARLAHFREERRQWWARLGIIRLTGAHGTVGTYDEPPPSDVDPPPEPGWTVMDLLERELGAHLIAVDVAG